MKKRGGARKGGGRPRLTKPKPELAAAVDDSQVMTLRDIADYLHCSYSTAHRLARQEVIPSFKLGGGWRILKSEIDKWIAKGGRRLASEEPAVKRGGARRRKPRPRQ
jgi:excisionase family DNA binding protein